MSKSKMFDVEDSLELFHRFSIFVPGRVIKMESERDLDNGDEFGVSYSMSSIFLKNLAALEYINHDPITIVLNTSGGDVVQGLAIYDAIRNSPCEITIKVYGAVYSMGSILLQAGDRRLMSPNAALMFHDGSSSAEGNSYETVNSALHNQALGQKCSTILLARINEKREKDNNAHMARHSFDIQDLKSKWMFAEQAVELGLADAIDTSPIGG